MKYVFTEYRKHENTALNKAPEDVLRVVGELGFIPFEVKSCVPKDSSFIHRAIGRLLWCFEEWRISRRLRRCDVVLLQSSPGFLCRRAGRAFLWRLRRKGIRFIYLIHDAGELRESDPMKVALSRSALDFMFSICEVLIAHNARMKNWLADRGYPRGRIVELVVFDYLCNPQVPLASVGENRDVIIAGNLSAIKSAYMSGLKFVRDINWKLYGPNFDQESLIGHDPTVANTEYRGSFAPDELPLRLSGSWGLVWDGDSTDTCSGATGEYLRYNNPHKLSLYLACGIPVIIWSEAAEAEFVTSNHLGIAVASLQDIHGAITAIPADVLAVMRLHIADFARRIRQGEFTKKAISTSLDLINDP